MAREWKELIGVDGDASFGIDVFQVLCVVLGTFLIIVVAITTCADGAVPQDKGAAADSGAYGSTCEAGCGAACGG
ncbi:Hypothetical predicted protein [Olea europaea subsp. europaea]|uniref:Transmembrane protein n=1 Tax=Olea europaea subsp. europaea TaxID=158383 RepID=A0A8S0QX31_OLEEU|nr:Hypothetical predicted protein [Olea europaea subsp. europaea]